MYLVNWETRRIEVKVARSKCCRHAWYSSMGRLCNRHLFGSGLVIWYLNIFFLLSSWHFCARVEGSMKGSRVSSEWLLPAQQEHDMFWIARKTASVIPNERDAEQKLKMRSV